MSDQDPLNRVAEIYKPDEIKGLDAIEKEFSIEELKETISFLTRKIKLKVSNDSYEFYLVNLSEQKKYGSKISEKYDEQFKLCSTATLSVRDNQVFFPSSEFEGKGRVTKKEREEGGISEKSIKKNIHGGIKRGSISVDEDGDYVQKKEVEVYNDENEKLELIPSNLNLKNSPNEVIIEDTLEIEEVFDIDVRYRYVLFPVEEEGSASANLIELLYDLEDSDPPKYLALKFNFYASYTPRDAFLQIIEENENEYILLNAGNKVETKYFGTSSSIGDVLEISEDFDFDLSI